MTTATRELLLVDTLKLALRALNAAPRFRVGETDSYAIASRVESVLVLLGENR